MNAEEIRALSDEELFNLLREQVTWARNIPDRYDPETMRAVACEARRRDWAAKPKVV